MINRSLPVLALLVVTIASGCGANHGSAVAASQSLVPVMERHGVTNFIWTNECEFVAYERGAFSTDPASEACMLHIDTPGQRRPIDPEARRVLDELYAASESVGPRVDSAAVTLRDGHVASGTFNVDSDIYWFEPGYTSMEDDDWFCSTEPVNSDWYVWDC